MDTRLLRLLEAPSVCHLLTAAAPYPKIFPVPFKWAWNDHVLLPAPCFGASQTDIAPNARVSLTIATVEPAESFQLNGTVTAHDSGVALEVLRTRLRGAGETVEARAAWVLDVEEVVDLTDPTPAPAPAAEDLDKADKRRKAAAQLPPLIYSCSGCSSAAQMANAVALGIDKQGGATMSCIAGVGGRVKTLVKIARSGRPIVALDGCPLHCAKSCLAGEGVEPTLHFTLSDYGVQKRRGVDFDRAEAEHVQKLVTEAIADLEAQRDRPARPACSGKPDRNARSTTDS